MMGVRNKNHARKICTYLLQQGADLLVQDKYKRSRFVLCIDWFWPLQLRIRTAEKWIAMVNGEILAHLKDLQRKVDKIHTTLCVTNAFIQFFD